MVRYTTPERSKIRIEDIQPTGWEDPPEYLSQPEEAYMPSQSHHPFEITIEDLSFNTPAEVVEPEFVYSQINTIFGDDWEDDPENDLESFFDNESLHTEDWEVHPKSPEYMSPEDTCTAFYTPRLVKQAEEDCLISTKDEVNKAESSNPARPTVNVITRNDPKGKLPKY